MIALVHPDDLPIVHERRALMEQGQTQFDTPMLVRFMRKDDALRWVEVTNEVIPAVDGTNGVNVLFVAKDVTELVEKNLALEEAAQELQASQQEIQKAHAESQSRLKIMTQEVELAKTMQEAILPQDFPNHAHYEINAFMKAARIVGGDFYDFFELDNYRVGLVIADVSGKGVPAAFFMSMSRAVMEMVARKQRASRLVLTEVNRRLCEHSTMGLFVTMFYGILDLRTGQLTYSNGGHNNPYIVRSGGGIDMLEPMNNLVLAAFEDTRYIQKEAVLAPGDTLFLYTDGFTEAFNAEHQMFRDARLIESLNRSHDQPVEDFIRNVLDDVYAFVGGHEQSDDLTCLVLRLKGLSDSADH